MTLISKSELRDELNTLRTEAYIMVIDVLIKEILAYSKENKDTISEEEKENIRIKFTNLTEMKEFIKNAWLTIRQMEKESLNHTIHAMQLNKRIRVLEEKVTLLDG